MQPIIFGNDHAGFEYKTQLLDFLDKNKLVETYFPEGVRATDVGCYSDDSVDYPDFVHTAIENSLENDAIVVLICGSGNGVSMTANKYPSKRAALCWNAEIAKLARQHNNANVLCIPARFVSIIESRNILLTFLTTEFEGGRHERRVKKINANTQGQT
jgi:ribose 5-phosphate isomerase B